eukprot:525212-Hanusia_phi.AAC.8
MPYHPRAKQNLNGIGKKSERKFWHNTHKQGFQVALLRGKALEFIRSFTNKAHKQPKTLILCPCTSVPQNQDLACPGSYDLLIGIGFKWNKRQHRNQKGVEVDNDWRRKIFVQWKGCQRVEEEDKVEEVNMNNLILLFLIQHIADNPPNTSSPPAIGAPIASEMILDPRLHFHAD